jgi:hypothetical protein
MAKILDKDMSSIRHQEENSQMAKMPKQPEKRHTLAVGIGHP